MQVTSHAVAANLPTEQFMQRERRRLKARHIWEELKPDWKKLHQRLYTNHVTGLGWKKLHERFFLNMYRNEVRFMENQYKGSDFDWVKAQWDKTRLWFEATARFPSQLAL